VVAEAPYYSVIRHMFLLLRCMHACILWWSPSSVVVEVMELPCAASKASLDLLFGNWYRMYFFPICKIMLYSATLERSSITSREFFTGPVMRRSMCLLPRSRTSKSWLPPTTHAALLAKQPSSTTD
jgi:hypothetical protein